MNLFKFLQIQVIYKGKAKKFFTKYTFPDSFAITFSEKHWSNTENSISFLKKIVFPHFEHVRRAKGYPDEPLDLAMMETFKEQGNEEETKLCRENNYTLIIAPHT